MRDTFTEKQKEILLREYTEEQIKDMTYSEGCNLIGEILKRLKEEAKLSTLCSK